MKSDRTPEIRDAVGRLRSDLVAHGRRDKHSSRKLFKASLVAISGLTVLLAIALLLQPGVEDSPTLAALPEGPSEVEDGPADLVSPREEPTALSQLLLSPKDSPTPVLPTAVVTPTPLEVPILATVVLSEYTVQPGDSLSLICQELLRQSMLEECISDLIALNGLASDGGIASGQVLKLPSP